MVRLADGGVELEGLAERARTSPTSLVLVLDEAGGPPDSWTGAVEAPSRELLDWLGRVASGAAGDVGSVTVVVRTSDRRTVLSGAAVDAVRGCVGAAALELGAEGIRVNAVVLDETVPDEDVSTTVGYLTDDVAGAFTTGATVRLHTPPELRSAVPRGRETTGVVLVTGGAGGIGSATAECFVRAGYDVVVTDQPGDALDTVAERLGVPVVPCDVTDPDALDRLAEHELLESGLAALVVQHGVPASTRLAALDADVAARSLAVNGTAVWALVDRLTPSLRQGDPGTVVALASQAGLVAEPGNAPYCAAKFAVVGLVRGLAPQLAPVGVRVQAICPGAIDTSLLRGAFADFARDTGMTAEEFTASRVAGIALGRLGEPAEIGASSLFLARLHSTGVVLAPTGGEVLT